MSSSLSGSSRRSHFHIPLPKSLGDAGASLPTNSSLLDVSNLKETQGSYSGNLRGFLGAGLQSGRGGGITKESCASTGWWVDWSSVAAGAGERSAACVQGTCGELAAGELLQRIAGWTARTSGTLSCTVLFFNLSLRAQRRATTRQGNGEWLNNFLVLAWTGGN